MKIKKADYLTMTVVAERLGCCEPDALAIVERIERLKRSLKNARAKLRKRR